MIVSSSTEVTENWNTHPTTGVLSLVSAALCFGIIIVAWLLLEYFDEPMRDYLSRKLAEHANIEPAAILPVTGAANPMYFAIASDADEKGGTQANASIAGYHELGDARLAVGAALLMLMAGAIPLLAARASIRIRQDELINPVLTRSLLYLSANEKGAKDQRSSLTSPARSHLSVNSLKV